MLLYLGPETLIPLASVAAAIAGVALLFGQRIGELSRRAYRLLGNLVSAVLSRLFPGR